MSYGKAYFYSRRSAARHIMSLFFQHKSQGKNIDFGKKKSFALPFITDFCRLPKFYRREFQKHISLIRYGGLSMKIEKLKVLGAKPFPAAAKSAIAASFGIAAAFTLNACDDSTSANSEQGSDPAPNSINSSETIVSSSLAEEAPNSSSLTEGPASSSQSDATSAETTPTSSSNSIPLSHEPVSSSLMEAISSALESSSSAAEPTSSTVEPASSASVPASSSSQPTDQEIKNACQMSGTPYVNIGAEVYFCPDVTGETVLFSMVSTFERTDAEV